MPRWCTTNLPPRKNCCSSHGCWESRRPRAAVHRGCVVFGSTGACPRFCGVRSGSIAVRRGNWSYGSISKAAARLRQAGKTAALHRKMSLLSNTSVLLGKELRTEFRSRELLTTTIVFVLIVVVLFSFNLNPTTEESRRFGPGLLCLAFLFAASLLLQPAFLRDHNHATHIP